MIAFVHPDFADKPVELSTAIDELLRAMFEAPDASYFVSRRVQTHIAAATWFDYVPPDDRPAARSYLSYARHLRHRRWGMRSLVEARHTIRGSASDSELVNRALLIEFASENGVSFESVRDALTTKYPDPDSVTQILVATSESQLELREGGDSMDQHLELVRRLAKDLQASLG